MVDVLNERRRTKLNFIFRHGFRLPQRSHLRTLKNFVSEKSGKRCKKSGKYWIKSINREILRRFIFFPVSAPDFDYYIFPFQRLSKEMMNQKMSRMRLFLLFATFTMAWESSEALHCELTDTPEGINCTGKYWYSSYGP